MCRDFSIADIAARSNIPVKVLEALESGSVDSIPGRFYIRGFIRSYLEALGADEKDFFLKHRREIDALTREDDAQKLVCFSKLKYKRFKSGRVLYLLLAMALLGVLMLMALPQAESLRSWLGIPERFSFLRLLGD